MESSLASWKGCLSIRPITGRSGHGVDALLGTVTDLVPKWTKFIPAYQLNSWRYTMSKSLAGALAGTSPSG